MGVSLLFGGAVREGLRLGHDYVGTEHLLLALLSEPAETPARLLADFGVGYGEAVAAFDRLLAAHVAKPRKK